MMRRAGLMGLVEGLVLVRTLQDGLSEVNEAGLRSELREMCFVEYCNVS